MIPSGLRWASESFKREAIEENSSKKQNQTKAAATRLAMRLANPGRETTAHSALPTRITLNTWRESPKKRALAQRHISQKKIQLTMAKKRQHFCQNGIPPQKKTAQTRLQKSRARHAHTMAATYRPTFTKAKNVAQQKQTSKTALERTIKSFATIGKQNNLKLTIT